MWGAPRIHGELLKLGFEIAESSVSKYMIRRRGPPSQTWRTFLRSHAEARWVKKFEGIVPVWHSLVGRCAAIGMMQQRIADVPIFVLGCCELQSQKQAQLKVGAFEPQPSVYQK